MSLINAILLVSVRITTSWEMKIIDTIYMQLGIRGDAQNCHFKGCNSLVAMITKTHFETKTSLKRSKIVISLSSSIQRYKLVPPPYIVTSFIFTLMHSIFPESECEYTNQLFISSVSVIFDVQEHRENIYLNFSEKCNDYGTETKHLVVITF